MPPTYRYDHMHLRSPDPEGTARWFEEMLGADFIRSVQEGQPRIDLKHGGANIFIALLDLMAGAVILAWPDLGLATLAVIIGIVLIVRGGLFIAAGWQLRTLDRAPEPDSGAPAVA